MLTDNKNEDKITYAQSYQMLKKQCCQIPDDIESILFWNAIIRMLKNRAKISEYTVMVRLVAETKVVAIKLLLSLEALSGHTAP